MDRLWRRWWRWSVAAVGVAVVLGALVAGATFAVDADGVSCGTLANPAAHRVPADLEVDVPSKFEPLFARWRAEDADQLNQSCRDQRFLSMILVAGVATVGGALVLAAREHTRPASTTLPILPHPLVLAACVVGGTVVAVSCSIDLVRSGESIPIDLVAIIFGVGAVVTGLRERVEADDEHVRVVRMLTEDRISRASVLSAQTGIGAGKPHLRLDPGMGSTKWSLALRRWPPSVHRYRGSSALPTTISAPRVAKALGVTCVTHRGGFLPPLRSGSATTRRH